MHVFFTKEYGAKASLQARTECCFDSAKFYPENIQTANIIFYNDVYIDDFDLFKCVVHCVNDFYSESERTASYSIQFIRFEYWGTDDRSASYSKTVLHMLAYFIADRNTGDFFGSENVSFII